MNRPKPKEEPDYAMIQTKKNLALDKAVSDGNLYQVEDLIDDDYPEFVLESLLLKSINNGNRFISDVIAKALDYKLGNSIVSLFSGIDIEIHPEHDENKHEIISRFLDLAKHRNGTIKYKNMEKMLKFLTRNTDMEMSRVFSYFIEKQPLTEKQVEELSIIAKSKLANSQTLNVIRKQRNTA